MSIQDFAAEQFYKIIETSELIELGGFTFAADEELKYTRHWFFIKGTITTDKFRVHVFSDSSYAATALLYTSDWSSFSDITSISSNWVGWVTATFNREHLKASREYFLQIETANYTRNASTKYLALRYDYDNSVYPKVSTSIMDYPLMTEFYTYKEIEL